MPVVNYDRYFGGEKGAAAKAKANMQRTYGKKDGETVFYATVAKRKRKAASARRRKWFT
jgi:hypothetical protein